MSSKVKWYIYNYDFRSPVQPGALTFPDWNSAISAIPQCNKEYFLLVDFRVLQYLDIDFINAENWYGDVIHCGYKFGSQKILEQLQVAALSWFFLNHSKDHRSVTWKSSAHLLLIRHACWHQLNGFFQAYSSKDVMAMDFTYRSLRSGGEVFYEPLLFPSLKCTEIKSESDDYNEFLFARKNIHLKAMVSLVAYRILTTLKVLSTYNSYKRAKEISLPSTQFMHGDSVWRLESEFKRKSIPRYSAIIPTLNRYEYLPAAIESLLNQTHPPDDIVVLDQSDAEIRNPVLFEKYTSVKVIFTDAKGQSTARNKALEHVQHQWCLLFDDDSVALPSMAEEHIKLLEYSEYEVSTGASLSPGQQFSDLPYTIDFTHHADVLDSGNCFINKKVLQEVDFFDIAFDKGPGADNDLGTRIYLKGIEILFNPKAIRIHFKAKTGGLRTYGVWWRFKTTLTGPYPPPSQTYTIRKFYPKKMWGYLYFRFFLKASYRQNVFQLIFLWLFAPIKLFSSIKEAKKLEVSNKRTL